MVEKEKLTGDIDDLLANPFGDLSKESAENKQELQEAGKQMGMDLFNKVGETKPKKLIETLPDEDKQRAYQLANQIDPKNQTSISLYGTQAQSKLMNFSSTMLDHVKSGNIGEIGEIITDLMKKLDQVNPDELQVEKRNIFSRMFGKMSRSVNEILARYQKPVRKLTESPSVLNIAKTH